MVEGEFQAHIEIIYQHLTTIEAEVDIIHRYLRLLGSREVANAKESNQEKCNQEIT